MYEELFSVFQRNPSHGLESLWGFFWTIAISFLILVGIIYFTDSPSSGMDGLGELPKRLSIKLEICLVIRALYRALGWHLARRRLDGQS